MGVVLSEIAAIRMCVYLENTEIVSINPLYPPVLGNFLKLGDTPRPPAECILHLFFSNLLILIFQHPGSRSYDCDSYSSLSIASTTSSISQSGLEVPEVTPTVLASLSSGQSLSII